MATNFANPRSLPCPKPSAMFARIEAAVSLTCSTRRGWREKTGVSVTAKTARASASARCHTCNSSTHLATIRLRSAPLAPTRHQDTGRGRRCCTIELGITWTVAALHGQDETPVLTRGEDATSCPDSDLDFRTWTFGLGLSDWDFRTGTLGLGLSDWDTRTGILTGIGIGIGTTAVRMSVSAPAAAPRCRRAGRCRCGRSRPCHGRPASRENTGGSGSRR